MDNLNKLVILIIRLQALGFILVGLIYWVVLAGSTVIASLQNESGKTNYSEYIIIIGCHLLVGIILYARSRSLAGYFIRGVEND
jgi:hypothetical protein